MLYLLLYSTIALVIVTLHTHCIPIKQFYTTWMLSPHLIHYLFCMYHVYTILCFMYRVHLPHVSLHAYPDVPWDNFIVWALYKYK